MTDHVDCQCEWCQVAKPAGRVVEKLAEEGRMGDSFAVAAVMDYSCNSDLARDSIASGVELLSAKLAEARLETAEARSRVMQLESFIRRYRYNVKGGDAMQAHITKLLGDPADELTGIGGEN